MISTEHKKVLSDILYRAGLFCIITFFSQTTDFGLKSALLLHTETPSIEKKEEREEKSEENKKETMAFCRKHRFFWCGRWDLNPYVLGTQDP